MKNMSNSMSNNVFIKRCYQFLIFTLSTSSFLFYTAELYLQIIFFRKVGDG